MFLITFTLIFFFKKFFFLSFFYLYFNGITLLQYVLVSIGSQLIKRKDGLAMGCTFNYTIILYLIFQRLDRPRSEALPQWLSCTLATHESCVWSPFFIGSHFFFFGQNSHLFLEVQFLYCDRTDLRTVSQSNWSGLPVRSDSQHCLCRHQVNDLFSHIAS